MDNEEYAKQLALRAEMAVKIMKILLLVTVGVAVSLFVFGMVATFAIEDAKARIAGFVVFIVLIAVLCIAVFGVLFTHL